MIALDEIRSNRVMRCIRCNCEITAETYSGWEAFTDDGKTTQPICKFCNAEETEQEMLKAPEPDELIQ